MLRKDTKMADGERPIRQRMYRILRIAEGR
jgi:hypothetical protein